MQPAKVTTLPLLLLLLLCCYGAAGQDCSPEQLQCSERDNCVTLRYICDGDNDCGDNSDEDSDLCEAWRNGDCDRGSVRCPGRDNICISFREYCNPDNTPACGGDVDPRICQIFRDEKLQDFSSIIVTAPATNLNASLSLGDEFQKIVKLTMSHPKCPNLFTVVGDRCLSLLYMTSISWGEADRVCQFLGGQLLIFRNSGHFSLIVEHLGRAKLSADFWVGGRYVAGEWQWVDNTVMPVGTPYWAVRYQDNCAPRTVTFPDLNVTREVNDGECYRYQQAPRNPPTGLCAAMNYEHFYYLADDDCTAKKAAICAVEGLP